MKTKFDKMTTENLPDIVRAMFPGVEIKLNKKFKYNGRNITADVYFEIDGQKYIVHYSNEYFYINSYAQLWENHISDMCKKRKIKLVLIPHFVHFGEAEMYFYFGYDICEKYKPHEKIEFDCDGGFRADSLPPSSYNSYGIKKFIAEYSQFISGHNDYWSVCKKIYNDFETCFTEIEFLGIDPPHDLKMIWIHYPT